MRYSKLFGKTLRQKPHAVSVISHELLLRGGFISPLGAGSYNFLPMGYIILEKIDRIIKEELAKVGVQHLLMPFVHPTKLWEETGRLKKMERVLAVFKAHFGRDYLLAPTHEETVTDLARNFIMSYRDIPVIVNQNQWKYRDEIRVKGGLLRTREFLMQDAYSFDEDESGLEKSFQLMSKTYASIFNRLGLDFLAVKADSGAIGGSGSEEYMILSDNGEDIIFVCNKCDYKANIEKAESIFPAYPQEKELKRMEEVLGKGLIGVSALAKFLGIPEHQTTKTLLYQADDRVVAVCVRGEYNISEVKLANYLKCINLSLASAETVKGLTRAEVGYAGPIGLPNEVEVVWDLTTEGRTNFEAGANKTNYHNKNVNFDRDVKKPERFIDVRNIKEGELCPKCSVGKLVEKKSIELGHIFKLGIIYSKAMGAKFINREGKEEFLVMGCYGIGITRVLAALVEDNHDKKGIIWPENVAPFKLHLLVIGNEAKTMMRADEVYQKLLNAGQEVLFDDRDVSAGQKFADADLIGIPYRLVISDKTGDKIEVKKRSEEKTELMNLNSVLKL